MSTKRLNSSVRFQLQPLAASSRLASIQLLVLEIELSGQKMTSTKVFFVEKQILVNLSHNVTQRAGGECGLTTVT